MVIAILVMGLMMVFVAASLSRVTNDALITGNSYAHTAAFYAAQASLEKMSRDFSKVFTSKTAITDTEITAIESNPPTMPGFTFPDQQILQLNAGQPPVVSAIPEGPYAGLVSLRDSWRLDTTAHSTFGDVKLTRTFYNHLIPIFQFAAFYESDMEFFPGGEMHIAGRVHTNGNLYLNGEDLHFGSTVTAANEIVTDIARNGTNPYYDPSVWVTNGSGSEREVTQGSVLGGPDLNNSDADVPNGSANSNWETFRTQFNDSLVAHAPRLQLPLQVDGTDPIEIIRRGKPGEANVLASARYYNQACIRVSLDDSRSRLPGGTGGIRLDGDILGQNENTVSGATLLNRGYQPKTMIGGYKATRVNGFRFFTDASYSGGSTYTSKDPRQTWIKVEIVTPNLDDPSQPTTVDITEDFLSLGVTEVSPTFGTTLGSTTFGDDCAIIKLQRFAIPGPPVRTSTLFSAGLGSASQSSQMLQTGLTRTVATYDTVTNSTVVAYNTVNPTASNALYQGEDVAANGFLSLFGKIVKLNGSALGTYQLVPFPIEMYDAREGLYHDNVGQSSTASAATMQSAWNTLYGGGTKLPSRGVMSVVDVDVANLRRFVNGDFDGMFPNGLSKAQVPNAQGRGLILYVSDRRGDADYDGVYDMENLFVNNASDTSTGTAQRGEDFSGANTPGVANLTPDGQLQVDYNWESCPYTQAEEADWAAVKDHKYYRRAVRLINGTTLPGTNTVGFTLASENGVYIQGNYNATGAGPNSASAPTAPAAYTGTSVPSSVVADAITILSRNWNDGKSFRRPLDYYTATALSDRYVPNASETTVRTAMLMGLSRSSAVTTPNQGGKNSSTGGNTQNLNGGVHNFPRFLEYWSEPNVGNTRCNYCGSMIGLFFSRVSNGSYKFGAGHIYSAPNRNWTFDTNFLDPTRLPPGTPFLQYIQLTGFRETFR